MAVKEFLRKAPNYKNFKISINLIPFKTEELYN